MPALQPPADDVLVGDAGRSAVDAGTVTLTPLEGSGDVDVQTATEHRDD